MENDLTKPEYNVFSYSIGDETYYIKRGFSYNIEGYPDMMNEVYGFSLNENEGTITCYYDACVLKGVENIKFYGGLDFIDFVDNKLDFSKYTIWYGRWTHDMISDSNIDYIKSTMKNYFDDEYKGVKIK